jgi:hypothetical protein
VTIAESAAKNSHHRGDPQIERLFPLPLTAFERYTLLDGETDAGLVFTLYIDVEGTIDRNAFEAAVAFASARHPLFRATIVGRWWWKYWSLEQNRSTRIDWAKGNDFPAEWRQPLDLSYEPGLSVLVQESDDRSRITARFHHACTDGVGAAQWLDDVMVHYATLTGEPGSAPGHNAIDISRLLDRQRDRWPLPSGLRLIGQSIRNFYKHFCQLPRPLAAPTELRSTALAPFDLVVYEFSEEETAALRQLAQENRASLNAWLLCDLFRAIALWNQAEDDQRASNPWYRVCMPISLRERADAATPATNLVGLTFLQRRRASLLGNRDELLRGVEEECREIKLLRRGTLFLQNLGMVSAIPGLLRIFLGMPVCYCTMTLTNLGDPGRRLQSQFMRQDGKLVFGNLAVVFFGGAPPLTRYLHGTISVNTYRDRLTLNLYMSPQRFSHAAAEGFMQMYVGEMRAALKAEKAVASSSLALPE